jgi:antitoxin component of MazEF toxin-antitoxin module
MRVQLVAGEYKVVLPPEAMEELQLKDGDAVKVVRAAETAESRSVGVGEAMKSYFETEPLHRESYRELAK